MDTSGHRWVLVKVKYFPAWHARGGRILMGPGGTMIVRTGSGRMILYFAYPIRLHALGALALALQWINAPVRAMMEG
ncbi:hypothetical protein [Methanopyrus kandleri]|uniref:Uncharacterized protein n=1 Tax=Methanopyrus kandleri (strain AV19 / DSM 6324 / JCM 9639 / NBRC 100938) TaxID=190192 RepID=Q8TWA3_METKA|nr:hypothetical protein [Methanopyrus kandleri]AAM02346.1 Uncharacterized protein MK1133 [Methanopyrus kandleri AV19]